MSLELELATRFGAASCRFYGRGSAALYALFSAIARRRGPGDVIIPAICCETVALAAIYAGMHPVIADVDPRDGTMAAPSVAERISPRTRAIVVVHVFGCAVDVPALRAALGANDAVLVEDLAQAIGGADRDGQLLGTQLDYTLLSFADDKILPGDGGALLRHARAPELDVDTDLPAPLAERALRRRALSLRNLTHALADLGRDDASIDVSRPFGEMVPHYRELIVRDGTVADPAALGRALAELEGIRRARFERYTRYRDGIRNPLVRVVAFGDGSMIWRCPILAADAATAAALTDRLREVGVPASNHYFPLDRLVGDRATPAAAAFASRVINLWVDPRTPFDVVDRAVDEINRFGSARG